MKIKDNSQKMDLNHVTKIVFHNATRLLESDSSNTSNFMQNLYRQVLSLLSFIGLALAQQYPVTTPVPILKQINK